MAGIPMKAVVLICMISLIKASKNPLATHKNRIVYKEDLPEDVVLNAKKIASIRDKMQHQLEVRFQLCFLSTFKVNFTFLPKTNHETCFMLFFLKCHYLFPFLSRSLEKLEKM